MTKIITPARHAVLDYATAAAFFALGFTYYNRNRAASTLAFANGASVLLLSLFTDYPGGVFRTLSFRTHGVMDAVQAGMAAAGPALCGFADTPQARTFYSQAVTEAAVIMGTDFSGRFDFAQAELAGE